MWSRSADVPRGEIYKIALQYADSEDVISATYFCEEYDITESVFRGIIARAVIESVVTEEYAKRISEKAGRNAERHGGAGAQLRSVKYHQYLMNRRKSFQFSKAKKIEIVTQYANSEGYIDLHIFSAINAICIPLLNRTIQSAIVDGLVSDEIIELLKRKALQRNDSSRVEKFFEQLIEERTAKKRKKKNKKVISEKKQSTDSCKNMQLQFVLETMDDYGIPSEMCEYAIHYKSEDEWRERI